MLLPYFEDCDNKLDNEIKEYCDTLMSGRIQSMEDYRSICGRIAGIRKAQEILKDVIRGYQNPNYLSGYDN